MPARRLAPLLLAAALVLPATAPQPAAAEEEVWVGPVYFSWFRVNRHGSVLGQYYGPWTPLEGRRAWDGSIAYHKEHLRHITKAGFNMIFAVDTFVYRPQQANLFAAVRERLDAGRKAPKVAPYFAAGSFQCRECPKDFSTAQSKQHFYDTVKRWLKLFFDTLGPEQLVWIDDRVLIGLWWVPGAETAEADFFATMNRKLTKDFGFEAFWSVNFTWENTEPDELNWTFASLDALEVNERGNADLLVGFWPPREHEPQNFLARRGGATYTEAWDQLIGRLSPCAEEDQQLFRITVVSYNELTEGSGIYPAACVSHGKNDRHWSGNPSLARCVDAPCHPHRKNDFWADDCSKRRAPFLYLDISKRKIRELKRRLRTGGAGCRGTGP